MVSYADAWLKWFDVIEQGAEPLSMRVVELPGIGGGRQGSGYWHGNLALS